MTPIADEAKVEAAAEIADKNAADARGAMVRALDARIRMSVARRTPYLSDQATKELAEDVVKNVTGFLGEVFSL